jgi:hypothetical protein
LDFSLITDNQKGGCVGDQIRGLKNKIFVSESLVVCVSSVVFIYFCGNSNIVKDLVNPTFGCVKGEGFCPFAVYGF